jgi:hypothetical protein
MALKFESKTSEFLECSCGNDVMSDGFDMMEGVVCENPHYVCGRCSAYACVDYEMRIVSNIGVVGMEIASPSR